MNGGDSIGLDTAALVNTSDGRCVYVLVDWENKDEDGFPLYEPGYDTFYIIFFILSVVVIIAAILITLKYKDDPHFKARSIPGILGVCVGTFFSVLLDCLRPIMGYENFPCALFVILSGLSFLLGFGGLVIQNVKFVNRAAYYEYLFSKVQQSGVAASDALGPEDIQIKLKKLKYKAEDRYGAAFLGLYVIFLVVANIIGGLFSSEYDYFSDCTGCAFSLARAAVLLMLTLFTFTAYCYTLYIVHTSDADPHNFKGETRLFILPALVVFVTYPALLLFTNYTYEVFLNDLVASMGCLLGVLIVTFYQVYYARVVVPKKVEHSDDISDALKHFLNLKDQQAVNFFLLYCDDKGIRQPANFIMRVEAWKAMNDRESFNEAFSILADCIRGTSNSDEYLKDLTYFERAQIDSDMVNAATNGFDIRRSVFTGAVMQCQQLLLDHMQDFLESEAHKQYVARNADDIHTRYVAILNKVEEAPRDRRRNSLGRFSRRRNSRKREDLSNA